MIGLLISAVLSIAFWSIFISEKDKALRKQGFTGEAAKHRIGNGAFVAWLFGALVIMILPAGIANAVFSELDVRSPMATALTFGVALTGPAVLRLRDIRQSSWWALLMLVPFMMGIAWLALAVWPSRKTVNTPAHG